MTHETRIRGVLGLNESQSETLDLWLLHSDRL